MLVGFCGQKLMRTPIKIGDLWQNNRSYLNQVESKIRSIYFPPT